PPYSTSHSFRSTGHPARAGMRSGATTTVATASSDRINVRIDHLLCVKPHQDNGTDIGARAWIKDTSPASDPFVPSRQESIPPDTSGAGPAPTQPRRVRGVRFPFHGPPRAIEPRVTVFASDTRPPVHRLLGRSEPDTSSGLGLHDSLDGPEP